MKLFANAVVFEWDKGNTEKNWLLHRVTREECEEIFYDPHKRVMHDTVHSGQEERHLLIGKTKNGRLLFIVFTIRGERLRVISARDLNKKERPLYEEKTRASKISE